MSSLKIKLDPLAFQAHLEAQYPDTSPLTLLKGGEVSQAFAFQHKGRDLVVKLRDSEEEYRKEMFVAELCRGTAVPIPKVDRIGKWKDLFYLVSEKASGKTLGEYTHEDIVETLSNIFAMLEKVHTVALTHEGYGIFNEKGDALHLTWKEGLLSIFQDSWYEWEEFKNIPEMQGGTFEKLYYAFERYLPFISEERKLIHTDCSFDNICAKDGEITGIFDWEMAMYGDPLYDIAWMDFWHKEYEIAERYTLWTERKGLIYTYYKERILCYQLHFGLRTLAFYRRAGLFEEMLSLKERLLQIIK